MVLRTVLFSCAALLVLTGMCIGKETTVDSLVITIVYDNVTAREDVVPAWGFSCLIQGLEKTILFDTGADGPTLLTNMRQLGLDPEAIDAVVLSHMHGDHTGGLSDILQENPSLTVFLLESFPEHLKAEVNDHGAELIAVSDPLEICDGALSTGEMGVSIPEQGLIIRTARGLVIVTGCAHPGIVEMVERSVYLGGSHPYLVLGGFHLFGTSRRGVRGIIDRFRELGVLKAAPCHCTGPEAIEMFKENYDQQYVPCGVGRVISVIP